MNTLEILFFVLLFIVFYTYVGYGILLWILVKIKQRFYFLLRYGRTGARNLPERQQHRPTRSHPVHHRL